MKLLKTHMESLHNLVPSLPRYVPRDIRERMARAAIAAAVDRLLGWWFVSMGGCCECDWVPSNKAMARLCRKTGLWPNIAGLFFDLPVEQRTVERDLFLLRREGVGAEMAERITDALMSAWRKQP